ncbi:DsbA family protein [Bacillus thermotolerans]|uniref:Periplasmic thiol:disulfide interchange protein DsbA n=1 Tax=Bacillus thermotolerans TaxID=1221996 RepID=A0A0F5HPE6_BACTR|nr:DsbA family protein [Bacillus thermotolerans]KKB34707.1 Periplasmic thiol:disulfide interchange protein DsbA [Bacillus thermotolerans]KKB38778.1 Periplasmic thiol:disulfide interchange protein DsbA [Bacillus thermotolerans]
MKNSKNIVISTLVLFAAIVGLVLFLNREEEETVTETENSVKKHPPIENQPTIGEGDAPVSIVEFGDYKCPSCKAWGETVYPKLAEEYINTGKAKFSYINVLFHGKESTLAALASESVYKQDPKAFWSFHKAVFDAQPANQNHDDQWVTPEKLVELAKAHAPNIDMKQLEEDINTQGTMEEVSKDDQLVKDFSVPFTPTIIINGVMLEDPFDYETIVSLIEKGSVKEK